MVGVGAEGDAAGLNARVDIGEGVLPWLGERAGERLGERAGERRTGESKWDGS